MSLLKTPIAYEKKSGSVGFLGVLMIAMWFLLTIMAPSAARANDSAVALTAEDILPDIEAALAAKGMADGAEITLSNPGQTFYAVDAVTFSHASYNPQSGRFVLRIAGGATTITGFARLSESFPVLARAIDRGDIIQETDIVFIDSADMRAGVFLRDAKKLIGMEARRPLRAQSPLRPSDVTAPVLVEKGALVTVTFVMDGLRLTHQGVAMSAGSAGEVIAVKNIQSERMLKGVIDGRNLVSIAAPRAHLNSQES